jgi:hypothetical protein
LWRIRVGEECLQVGSQEAHAFITYDVKTNSKAKNLEATCAKLRRK